MPDLLGFVADFIQQSMRLQGCMIAQITRTTAEVTYLHRRSYGG